MRARIFGGLLSVSLLAAVGADNLQTQRERPVYGGSPEGTRYSSLKQITPANVKQLDVAWTCDTGDGPVAMTCGAVSYIESAATISARPARRKLAR
jgi:glucose dehydrogenase